MGHVYQILTGRAGTLVGPSRRYEGCGGGTWSGSWVWAFGGSMWPLEDGVLQAVIVTEGVH